jgi:hypothetical protein
MGIIYMCVGPSFKIYIGQTSRTLEERKQEHLRKALSGVVSQFYSALRKYKDQMNWKILEEVEDSTLLDDREKYWIDQYKSYSCGYNLTPGGEGGKTTAGRIWIHHEDLQLHKMVEESALGEFLEKGWKRGRNHNIPKKQPRSKPPKKENPYKGYEKSKRVTIYNDQGTKRVPEELLENFLAEGYTRGLDPELAARQGRSRRGRSISDKHRARLRESNLGRKKSEEEKKKIREKLKGREVSEESKQKMRESHLGKPLPDSQKKKIGDAQRGIPKRRRKEDECKR